MKKEKIINKIMLVAVIIMLLSLECAAQDAPVRRPTNNTTTPTPTRRQHSHRRTPHKPNNIIFSTPQDSNTQHQNNIQTEQTPTEEITPAEELPLTEEYAVQFYEREPLPWEGIVIDGIKFSTLGDRDDFEHVWISNCDHQIAGQDLHVPSVIVYNNFQYIVQRIASGTFSRDKSLRSVELPNTIEWIGENAFSWSLLEYIDFPSSITEIQMDAFSNTLLTSVKLNSDVKLGFGVFGYNKLLTTADVSTCSKISQMCFRDCVKLKDIRISEISLQSLPPNTFYGCKSLKKITVIRQDGSTYTVDAKDYKSPYTQ